MILDQFPDASDLYSDIGAISRCAKVWWRDDYGIKHDKSKNAFSPLLFVLFHCLLAVLLTQMS